MVAILNAEKITAAAIQTPAGVYWRTPPARHADLIRMIARGGVAPVTGAQGFFTDRRRFVGRVEAMFIASRAGQLKPGTPKRLELFSEDLW